MTDATERRLAALLAQMKEMLEDRLPAEMPEKRPDWQVYTFLAGVIFMSGALWYQVLGNTRSMHELMARDTAQHKEIHKEIDANRDNLTAHLQWELQHELAQKDAVIRQLEQKVTNEH